MGAVAAAPEQSARYRPPSAVSRPTPFPSTRAEDDEGVGLGARIAGVVLILNAMSTFYAGIALEAPLAGPGGSVSAVIDAILGLLLVLGRRGAVPFCLVRVVLGAVFFLGFRLYSGDVASAAIQLALSGSLLGLLIGAPGRVRIGLSSALAVSYVIAVAFILHGGSRVRNADALLASGEIEIIGEGGIQGVGYPYSFSAPNDRWFLRSREVTKRENPVADLWLVRPDKDAHFIVVAETFPGGAPVDVDAYQTAVLENLENASTRLEILERANLWEHYEQARRVHARAMVMGLSIDYLYGIVVFQDQGYQLIGFASQAEFPAVSGEFQQIFDSFGVEER